MKIDVNKIKNTLEELKKRDESKKGMQPELVLGCFIGLDRGNDDYCRGCSHYKITCLNYLIPFFIDDKPEGLRARV